MADIISLMHLSIKHFSSVLEIIVTERQHGKKISPTSDDCLDLWALPQIRKLEVLHSQSALFKFFNTTIPLHLKYLCAFIVVYLILVQRRYSSKASYVCPDRINGMDLKFNTVACFILSLIEKPSVQCKITACLCFTHSFLWLQGSSKYM